MTLSAGGGPRPPALGAQACRPRRAHLNTGGQFPDRIQTESDANPASQTTPDNAAHVIYTSGSTGLPKGVVNSHRGICNYTIWWREFLNLTAADRFFQKVPLTFDASVAEIFGALVSGARW